MTSPGEGCGAFPERSDDSPGSMQSGARVGWERKGAGYVGTLEVA